MLTPVARRAVRRTATTVALSAALVTSFAVNPGSASASAMPTRASAVSWSTSVFNALNVERAVNHVPQLLTSVRLTAIASLHNVRMAAYNLAAHQLPGELPARTRIERAGFSATTAGENLAQTTDWTLIGTLAQQRAMYVEPSGVIGRRANLLNPAFRYVGIDVAIDAVHHKLWITQDFSILPPSATPLVSTSTATMATQMLTAMNAERALNGRAALRMNSRLIQSAHGHNLKMAWANSMSHLLPGESGFLARLLQVGYNPRAAAENIGWNSDRTLAGVLYLQRIMYTEVPPDNMHRVNILNATYREVGIDIYMDNVHHKLWMTQDFGLPA